MAGKITFTELPNPDIIDDETGKPYVSYCTSLATADASRLEDPNTVVAPAVFKITITYPLKNRAIIDVNEPNPVTRRRFAEIVFREYKRIYGEEDESTKVPAGHIPGMYNRVQTTGKYGIWGHDIDDLDLVYAYLHEDGTYHLAVDS